MTRISNEILRDIYFEICEEQNIDIDSCEVYVKEIDDKDFPYALYVKTKEMTNACYFGDDLTENCCNNYIIDDSNITDLKINDTQWLFIEVLDDEHILIELHEKDDTESLRDSITLRIRHNEILGG